MRNASVPQLRQRLQSSTSTGHERCARKIVKMEKQRDRTRFGNDTSITLLIISLPFCVTLVFIGTIKKNGIADKRANARSVCGTFKRPVKIARSYFTGRTKLITASTYFGTFGLYWPEGVFCLLRLHFAVPPFRNLFNEFYRNSRLALYRFSQTKIFYIIQLSLALSIMIWRNTVFGDSIIFLPRVQAFVSLFRILRKVG